MGLLDLIMLAAMWYGALFGFAILVIVLIAIFERMK
jgi:hypothetical protein